LKLAGLLALHNLKSLPVIKNSGEEFKNFPNAPSGVWGVVYSYGDSSGIKPDSLLIAPWRQPITGTKVAAILLNFQN